MLADQLIGVDGRLVDQLIRFASGILKDGFLVVDDSLIMLDLLGSSCAKLLQKSVELILIYDNILLGKLLRSSAVDKIFDLVNLLFNLTAHVLSPNFLNNL